MEIRGKAGNVMLNISSLERDRLVLPNQLHKYQKSDFMQGGVNVKQRKNLGKCENNNSSELVKYDMQIQHGKTKICIVSPPPMTQEETEKVLDDFYATAWSIINSIAEK